MSVVDVGGKIVVVLCGPCVGGVKFLKEKLLEVLVSCVKVSVLGELVSSDKHTIKCVVMSISGLSIGMSVVDVGGEIVVVLCGPCVCGIKLLKKLFKVLISCVKVSILGELVS